MESSADKPADKPRSKSPDEYTFLDTELLLRHTTDTGKILPRRITGMSAAQQRHLSKTVKRARQMLMMK